MNILNRTPIWLALVLPSIYSSLWLLWHHPYHLFQDPPRWVATSGIGLLLLLNLPRHGPSVSAWAWWGLGLLSLLWSLAPGHTLVASLWEVWLLLALAAGRWRLGVLVLLSLLLLDGLYTALALWQAGLVSYVSGSHHYLLGALALGALPLFLAQVARGEGFRVAGFLLLVLSLYAALISGARAVYLPLLILLPLAYWRLAREGRAKSAAFLLLWAFLGVGLLEVLVPGNAILNALAFKATLTQQEALAPQEGAEEAPRIGNVEARLLMARLAFRIALEHPLGTGNGSYSQVFEAYMDYSGLPGVWSRSPHNYLLETLATGGWMRLGLLLILLWPAVKGFFGRDWPWALGTFGLWAPMLFDVSGYYPGYLALAFLLLGTLSPASSPRWLGLLGVLLASLLALGWYWPCQGTACAQRHLFFPSYTTQALAQASLEERHWLLQEAQRHYPLSPWPLTVALPHAPTPEARLELARELALRFPYARESFYVLWAHAALEAKKVEETRKALDLGLRHFPSSSQLREIRDHLDRGQGPFLEPPGQRRSPKGP